MSCIQCGQQGCHIKCLCWYYRCWPPTCCLSSDEKMIRGTSKKLFGIVNTQANICGCEDSVLEKTETMLLFNVIEKEKAAHDGKLRQHSALLGALLEQLKTKTADDSADGSKINKMEFEDAMMKAASVYINSAVQDIANEMKNSYNHLEAGIGGRGGAKVVPSGAPLSETMVR